MPRTLVTLLAVLLVTGCQEPSAGITIHGVVTAGPVCPIVTDPPDPACDDRPVAGAEIVVRDDAGAEVARARSADDGSFSVTVAAAGRYRLLPQPVEGLLGTAASIDVIVGADANPPVDIVYDTGIR